MTFGGSPCHHHWKVDEVGSEVYASVEWSQRQPQIVMRSRISGFSLFRQEAIEESLIQTVAVCLLCTLALRSSWEHVQNHVPVYKMGKV